MADWHSQHDRKMLADQLRAQIEGTLVRRAWFQHRGDHGDAAIELAILTDLEARLAVADASALYTQPPERHCHVNWQAMTTWARMMA